MKNLTTTSQGAATMQTITKATEHKNHMGRVNWITVDFTNGSKGELRKDDQHWTVSITRVGSVFASQVGEWKDKKVALNKMQQAA